MDRRNDTDEELGWTSHEVTPEQVLEQTIARKRDLIGLAAVVLNPLRTEFRQDISDDTALLIQTLDRCQTHFRLLEGAGFALTEQGQLTYRMVTESLTMIRDRMEEQR